MLWGALSTFTSNSNEQHWKEIGRVSRYLKGSYTFALSYLGYPGMLEGYSDASWITGSHESKSTSGWIFTVSGTAMSCASKKETFIAHSTMEYGFLVFAAAGKEAEWLRNVYWRFLYGLSQYLA